MLTHVALTGAHAGSTSRCQRSSSTSFQQVRVRRGTSLIRNSLPLGTYGSICSGPHGDPSFPRVRNPTDSLHQPSECGPYTTINASHFHRCQTSILNSRPETRGSFESRLHVTPTPAPSPRGIYADSEIQHLHSCPVNFTPKTWDLSGRGTTRGEDAQWTPTQSRVSPSIQVYTDYSAHGEVRSRAPLFLELQPFLQTCTGISTKSSILLYVVCLVIYDSGYVTPRHLLDLCDQPTLSLSSLNTYPRTQDRSSARDHDIKGYLTHKEQPPPRTLLDYV